MKMQYMKKQYMMPSCKEIHISAPILRLNNKNANNILKKFLDKLKVVEENKDVVDVARVL